MGENASFLDKLFFRYPWKILESSMTQQMKHEQYGNLPEHQKIKYHEKDLEEGIKNYIKKNPEDRLAFMKGMLVVNKWKLAKFCLVRVLLQAKDYITPFIMGMVITWVQKQEEEPFEDTMYMVALALCCPLLGIINHVVWEYFCYQMIQLGEGTTTSLKSMLFRKNFKMTGATNKDFTSGEINHIIQGETGRIWTFIWQGPSYIEIPMNLILSAYLVFTYIGWSGLIVLLGLGLHWALNYVRGKTEKEINEKKREFSTERMKYINESFYNIKSLKLFGWESKFLNKIEECYVSEKDLD